MNPVTGDTVSNPREEFVKGSEAHMNPVSARP